MDVKSSVIQTIKTFLGSISEEQDAFDEELKLHINSALGTFKHMGLPDPKTLVSSTETTWDDLFGQSPLVPEIAYYIYIRVKVLFDTPSTSYIINAFQQEADKVCWYLQHAVEDMMYTEEEGGEEDWPSQNYITTV